MKHILVAASLVVCLALAACGPASGSTAAAAPTQAPTSAPQPTGAPTATATSAPAPTEIVDTTGSVMRLVPAAEFTMGRGSGEQGEQAAHTVSLDAFYIDAYEVTNRQYEICVGAGACNPPLKVSSNNRQHYYGNSIYANYPVLWVTWRMAVAYCVWRGAALPTEAQWELAAGGTDGRTYPWGNYTDRTIANYGDPNGDTTEVGDYPDGRSPYGLYDMAGNVWEWVADWYDPHYYQKSPIANPLGPTSGQYGIVRGGTWSSNTSHIRVAYRYAVERSMVAGVTIGFRCARPNAAP